MEEIPGNEIPLRSTRERTNSLDVILFRWNKNGIDDLMHEPNGGGNT
jgi:hypothetical protein